MTKLVDATMAYLDDVDADVVVMDALIPYMPTLLALGYDEPAIDEVIDGLTARIATRRSNSCSSTVTRKPR